MTTPPPAGPAPERAEEVEALARDVGRVADGTDLGEECAAALHEYALLLRALGNPANVIRPPTVTGIPDLGWERARALIQYDGARFNEGGVIGDTRPRFDGGARSQEDGGRREVTRMIGPTGWHDEDRCAPLVEALRNITGAEESSPWQEAYQAAGGRYEGLQAIALAALRAHREREGVTDG